MNATATLRKRLIHHIFLLSPTGKSQEKAEAIDH